LALLGGIVALDETAFLQVMISRPLISGALVGLVLGDPVNGLLLGSILEMIYLDVLPAGAVRFPDSGLAAVVGTGLLVLSGKYFSDSSPGIWMVAILLAIVTGSIGGWSITFVRQRNGFLLKRVEDHLRSGKLWAVECYHLMGLLFSFARGAVLTFVFSSLFLAIMEWAGPMFESSAEFPLVAGRNMIICASLALGLRLFVKGRTFVYFVIGAGVTITFMGLGI